VPDCEIQLFLPIQRVSLGEYLEFDDGWGNHFSDQEPGLHDRPGRQNGIGAT
jgi:hypothetical protein